jgi:glutamate dehydrogenase
VAAFLEWAKNEGFEPFGYAYYVVKPGVRELERDIPSRIGVLQDTSHPVYGTCLANIPGDFDTLSKRPDALSIVKADVEGTLHRDQPLDFIGVRNTDAQGNILGEHCFVGLFTRAATATPLARLPFARGRVAKVLSLAGVRQEGFRAEKFLEILESLPRTEALEADPEWLAQVCSSVVSLYKQPRAKVFARRDVYARHLNVLVYLPRERYSASVAASLAHALKESSGATRRAFANPGGRRPAGPRLPDRPRRAQSARPGVRYPAAAAVGAGRLARQVRRADRQCVRRRRPAAACASCARPCRSTTSAATAPAWPSATWARCLATAMTATCRCASKPRSPAPPRSACIRWPVPSLSRILPALHNAGVAIDREQTFDHMADGTRHFVTSLAVDADSAAKLAKPNVVPVAQELFTSLFNNEAEDGRLNGLVIEGGLSHARSAAGARLHELLAPDRQQVLGALHGRHPAPPAGAGQGTGRRLPAALRSEALPKRRAWPRANASPRSRRAWRRSTTPTPRKSWPPWST